MWLVLPYVAGLCLTSSFLRFGHLLAHLWEGKFSKNGEVKLEKYENHWLTSLEKLRDMTR